MDAATISVIDLALVSVINSCFCYNVTFHTFDQSPDAAMSEHRRKRSREMMERFDAYVFFWFILICIGPKSLAFQNVSSICMYFCPSSNAKVMEERIACLRKAGRKFGVCISRKLADGIESEACCVEVDRCMVRTEPILGW
jgi:hypothetical protein